MVSLEVAGGFVEPDGIVARSHLLWAAQVEPSRPMPMAPEPILRAALHVVHVAACTTRNWTYADGWPRQQVYDLWEALHEVPDLVTRWRPDAEQELLRYLEEYDRKWPSPRLREMYQRHIALGGQA